MALIVCPECNASISSDAAACPHCGYPLQKTSAQTQQESHVQPQTAAESRPKKRIPKILIILILAVIVVIAVVVLFVSRTPSVAKVIHSSTGDTISIGMQKDVVEDLIGGPWIDETYAIYEDGLSLTYDRGDLVGISWDGSYSGWETEAGIGIGDSLDDVFQTYGEEDVSSVDDLKAAITKDNPSDTVSDYLSTLNYDTYVIYYFGSTGSKTDDLASATYSMNIDFKDNRVVSITLKKG